MAREWAREARTERTMETKERGKREIARKKKKTSGELWVPSNVAPKLICDLKGVGERGPSDCNVKQSWLSVYV